MSIRKRESSDRYMFERHKIKNYDVLIVMDYYLPGRLSGGPVTTIETLIQRLGGELRFLVVTQNQDIDGRLYENYKPHNYYRLGESDIIYITKKEYNRSLIRKLSKLHSVKYIYFNSFFSKMTVSCLVLSKLRSDKAKILVAPRGEFSVGALNIKSIKKRIYLCFFILFSVSRRTLFQASSENEAADVKRVLGSIDIRIASDMTPLLEKLPPRKIVSETKVIFISRIVPIKNLDFAIKIVSTIKKPLQFDIYGPIEDEKYWEKCQALIRNCPTHINIRYCGIIEHSKITSIFRQYDAFLFPTLGENFGHVVIESLFAGCPVIISDRTPWLDLSVDKIGWIGSLKEKESFTRAVEEMIDETDDEKTKRSQRCIEYAYKFSTNIKVLEDNRELFR